MTFVAVAMLAAGVASAQDPRVEISGLAGWTFSDGVTGAAATVPGVGTFNGIEPKDSFSWGLTAGFFVTPNVQVEFLFDQQQSKLAVPARARVDIGDMSVSNYHGVLAYNFGASDAQVRPFVFGGLGATRYGSLTFTGAAGQARELGGETQFSTTWGAGLKLYPGKSFGIRLQGSLDAHLHQVGRGGLVVRPLLGLLHRCRTPSTPTSSSWRAASRSASSPADGGGAGPAGPASPRVARLALSSAR